MSEITYFSGWLMKRSPPGSFIRMVNWKRRFFEFGADGQMCYYTDESKVLLKNSYHLDHETEVGLSAPMEGFDHVIRIVTKSREIFLAASSEENRNEWFDKIREWCHSHKAISRIIVAQIPESKDDAGTQDVVAATSTSALTSKYHDKYPSWDHARRDLYSEDRVPAEFLAEKYRLETEGADLHFSDHAFGAVPPYPLYKAQLRNFGYHTGLANGLWAALWGSDIPAACGKVKKFLGFQEDSDEVFVEVAHNVHQFISNLFSSRFDRIVGEACTRPLRFLTSDVEFYSITRQLNRFLDSKTPRMVVECIPARPVETFPERVIAYLEDHADTEYDFIYFSHVSFIQLTLIPNLKPFVAACRQVLERNGNEDAIIVIDGFHSFAAFEVDLSDCDCIFIFGVLKHIGCGTNLTFATVPKKYCTLRPFITGWLADFSVLSPTHTGVKIGSRVDYQPGVVMMGSTVAFSSAVFTFNNVIDAWSERGITAHLAHAHVMALHQQLLDGFDRLEAEGISNPFVCRKRLMILQPEAYRSNTLVFVQDNPTCAMLTVNYFATHRITLDSRNRYVRLGVGLNHNPEDIERVLNVLSMWSIDSSNVRPSSTDASRTALMFA